MPQPFFAPFLILKSITWILLPLTRQTGRTAALFCACLVQLAQHPDCVAQCQQEECFPAQISTPHKCLALCLTLSGL